MSRAEVLRGIFSCVALFVHSEQQSSLRGTKQSVLINFKLVARYSTDCFVVPPRKDAQCYTVQVCDARNVQFIFFSWAHKYSLNKLYKRLCNLSCFLPLLCIVNIYYKQNRNIYTECYLCNAICSS